MFHKKTKPLNQEGFASIVIALILIIVLALLTVGFAQLARREQKSALNKQLASQAYYAAESGVNDTAQQLPAYEISPPANAGRGKCLNANPVAVNTANGVNYTCVILNLHPPNIKYDNIQPEQDRYITTNLTTPASSLTVSWGSTDGHNSYAANTNNKFTPTSSWGNQPGVLEFTVTPLGGTDGLITRAQLDTYMTDHAFTVYLYPTANGGGGDFSVSVPYTSVSGQTSGNNGAIVSAKCSGGSAGYPCQAKISGLDSFGTGPYLFHIIDHYDPSNVSISGTSVAAGQTVNFDGQAQIDSTGQAHEVLKRIQVRVPRSASYDIPKDALQSLSTCKHFTTDPISATATVPVDQDFAGACSLGN